MAGRAYAIFDTSVGRCGIVWSDAGIVAVHLPEEREITTRGRLFRLYPEAREVRPPSFVEIAIEGIATQLRGRDGDFSGVALDMSGISAFNQRVYEFTRTIPRGETRTYREVAAEMRREGTERSVAQAIAKNPFMIIVPCHRRSKPATTPTRFLPTAAPSPSAICCRLKAPIRSPARPCSTFFFRLPRRAPITDICA